MAEYIVAIDVTRIRFLADAYGFWTLVERQVRDKMEHLRGRIRNYNSRLRRLLREGGTEIVQLLVARPVAKLHKKDPRSS